MMKTSAISLLLASALVCMSASATPLDVTATSMEYQSPTKVIIHPTRGPSNRVYSGAFATRVSDQTDPLATWCVDLYQETYLGQTVGDYKRMTGSDALGSRRATALERLATESLSRVSDAETSSAFQLAVWEIIDETGPLLDPTSGSFKATGASDGSLMLAADWLRDLPGTDDPVRYTLSVLQSNSRQDLAYFTEVPEPSTLAALVAGLIAFAVSRRAIARLGQPGPSSLG